MLKNYDKLKWIAEHAFLSFLALALISLFFGSLVFYRYSILVERMDPEPKTIPVQFNEALYIEVLEGWEERDEVFQAVDEGEYKDLFWSLTE